MCLLRFAFARPGRRGSKGSGKKSLEPGFLVARSSVHESFFLCPVSVLPAKSNAWLSVHFPLRAQPHHNMTQARARPSPRSSLTTSSCLPSLSTPSPSTRPTACVRSTLRCWAGRKGTCRCVVCVCVGVCVWWCRCLCMPVRVCLRVCVRARFRPSLLPICACVPHSRIGVSLYPSSFC